MLEIQPTYDLSKDEKRNPGGSGNLQDSPHTQSIGQKGTKASLQLGELQQPKQQQILVMKPVTTSKHRGSVNVSILLIKLPKITHPGSFILTPNREVRGERKRSKLNHALTRHAQRLVSASPSQPTE
jgi:hypothetical protein